MTDNNVIIDIENVHKSFGDVQALRGVTTQVHAGEVVVIIGPSGSGKSTLLRCINRLETVDSGSIVVDGIPITGKRADIHKVRAEVGMVFQSFNLFPHLTALDNVMLAQRVVRKRSSQEAREIALDLLNKVGIPEKADSYPDQLSGGQQQRVAIARAVVTRPKLILADEPTGNLDSANGGEVMALLTELNEEGTTIVMVTHSPNDAEKAHRIIQLFDGHVVTENIHKKL